MTGMTRRASMGLLLLLGLSPSAQAQTSAGTGLDESGAVIRNLVLPGWGFKHLERTDLARTALVREVSLWVGYSVLASAANWYQQDLRSYAAEHAGAEYKERDGIYYYRIARYASLDEYNQEMLRQRNLADVYPEGFGWEWSWDAAERMDDFEQQRVHSLNSAKAARFAIGGLVLNRVAAALQVLFVTRTERAVSAFLIPLGSGAQLQIHLNL